MMPSKQPNPNTTHLLIRHQEIALKGRNRPYFERRLTKNLARRVGESGKVLSLSGRVVVDLAEPARSDSGKLNHLISELAALSGVHAVTPCKVLGTDPERIKSEARDWARHDLDASADIRTFAVRTRRVDKKFPVRSNEIDITVGSAIQALKPGLTANLKKPDLRISIEIRAKHAMIYSNETNGVHGLPQDSSQRVICLLSGGIDSPVAACEIMRRGCSPVLVHFHSKPYTSEASIAKVKRLAAVIRRYSAHPVELWLVPLLDVQKAVRDQCNERHRTVHYRRFMMRIADELGRRVGAKAIVTGDALGQVASQTLTNLNAIEDAVKTAVLRPLISLDKDQIIVKARNLGTYEISIEPHDDACVLFASPNPSTQAGLSALLDEEARLPLYRLVFSALDAAEKIIV
ncbi:MAG: tRNA 4-thiouridine(8) synthase ThiI [Deltaproteobacteria bacterium]|nr:tRNA 4-thiouridine(8) synthase ThiI [Deltaproteobacteria bacterium]